eukprot:scaffold4674_cov84-Isochrysis_galbana.AAC.1
MRNSMGTRNVDQCHRAICGDAVAWRWVSVRRPSARGEGSHLVVLGLELGHGRVKVERREGFPGPALEGGQVLDDLRAERLGEAAVWDADGALEELDDRRGEGERVGLLADGGGVELVGHHELGQVAHHLGGR